MDWIVHVMLLEKINEEGQSTVSGESTAYDLECLELQCVQLHYHRDQFIPRSL